MTRATGWDARDAKFAGHRALVQENDGASGVLYRWECSCRRNGTWTSSRVQADKNGRRHETSRNAKSTKAPSEFRKGLQDLLTFSVARDY